MGKKSGKAGKADASAAPGKAQEATDAGQGNVAGVKGEGGDKQAGEYGGVKIGDHGKAGAAAAASEDEVHRVGIELKDEDGNPVPGKRVAVKLPSGDLLYDGYLDGKGKVQVEGIPEVQCKISFPDIHGDEWSLKQ